ncbi:SDH family Clp fold serine proteinase [Mycobacterium sp. SMC-17]|uniref:SDH family Clp fold serine proteinase n=1 Tax=Mycobacterium sp. SMC-17 TaxID=3381628 RepID=UPI0038760097
MADNTAVDDDTAKAPKTRRVRAKSASNGRVDGHASGAVPAGADGPKAQRTVLLAFLQHGDGPTASIGRHTVEQVRKALDGVDPADREHTTLDVWLESGGGDAHSAYKIGLIFRSVASYIRVVVPDYAKSAATLLSLVADEIYMAPAAELGPLDAQVTHEQEGITVSALDRARSLDDLTETAMDIVLRGGGMVLQYTRLSRAEAITAMLDFSAKFMEPIVAKIDPTMLHWSNSLLRVAKEYGKRLMETRSNCPPGLSSTVPAQLLEEYPTHGFVVSRAEAEGLGLPVKPIEDYEHLAMVNHAYRTAEQHAMNLIGVVPFPPGDGQTRGEGEELTGDEGDECRGERGDDSEGGNGE